MAFKPAVFISQISPGDFQEAVERLVSLRWPPTARSMGWPVIGITDCHFAPLAPFTDLCLKLEAANAAAYNKQED